MTPEHFPLPTEIFTGIETPANVRRADAFEHTRVCRAFRKLHRVIRRRLFTGNGQNHEGRFVYRRGGASLPVGFDGRNTQFHALYEPFYARGYEAETALLLLRLARGSGAFYDIGANWGYFSLLLAAAPAFTGKIIAFEPNPPTFADLRRTIAESGTGDRILAKQAGIGATRSELRVSLPDRFHSGLARLSASGDGEVVPVFPLDELDLPAPHIVKIDAEGMELAVLQGAKNTLQQHRPHVVFESFRDFEQPEITRAPLQYLHELGYRLFNPALAFSSPSGPMLTSYGIPFAELLAKEPRPPTALVRLTPVNRFLMANQLNVWACHESRLGELPADQFVRIDDLWPTA